MTRIAVAINNEDEQMFWHFGHCERFKIYDVEKGAILHSDYLMVLEDHGHSKLAAMFNNQVNVVIADGMGPGVVNAAEGTGLEIISGFKGTADDAVKAYLDGTIVNDPEAVKPCGAGHGC